jgi:hypothetical protein
MVLEVINPRKVKNNVYIFYIVLYTLNQLLNDPYFLFSNLPPKIRSNLFIICLVSGV